MKVRAIADGTYAGYYRHGPIIGADGTIPGEVFEISDEIVTLREPTGDGEAGAGRPLMEPVIDELGNPVMERVQKAAVDMAGNPVVDEKTHKPVMVWTEKPKMRVRTTSHFSPAWMEKVPDNTPVTYEYPPFQIPSQFRTPKQRPAAAPAPMAAGQNLLPVI